MIRLSICLIKDKYPKQYLINGKSIYSELKVNKIDASADAITLDRMVVQLMLVLHTVSTVKVIICYYQFRWRHII